jgi:hypothetical protein
LPVPFRIAPVHFFLHLLVGPPSPGTIPISRENELKIAQMQSCLITLEHKASSVKDFEYCSRAIEKKMCKLEDKLCAIKALNAEVDLVRDERKAL